MPAGRSSGLDILFEVIAHMHDVRHFASDLLSQLPGSLKGFHMRFLMTDIIAQGHKIDVIFNIATRIYRLRALRADFIPQCADLQTQIRQDQRDSIIGIRENTNDGAREWMVGRPKPPGLSHCLEKRENVGIQHVPAGGAESVQEIWDEVFREISGMSVLLEGCMNDLGREQTLVFASRYHLESSGTRRPGQYGAGRERTYIRPPFRGAHPCGLSIIRVLSGLFLEGSAEVSSYVVLGESGQSMAPRGIGVLPGDGFSWDDQGPKSIEREKSMFSKLHS